MPPLLRINLRYFKGIFRRLGNAADRDNPDAPLQRAPRWRDEIDAEQNWISIDSPMARALIGQSVDDEVEVKTPDGERYFGIMQLIIRGIGEISPNYHHLIDN